MRHEDVIELARPEPLREARDEEENCRSELYQANDEVVEVDLGNGGLRRVEVDVVEVEICRDAASEDKNHRPQSSSVVHEFGERKGDHNREEERNYRFPKYQDWDVAVEQVIR